MPDTAKLTAFAIASLIVAATPGPGVLFLVARTVAEGRRAGFLSVLGVALGNLCNGLTAMLGIAALFNAVPAAATAMRYAGAAYLIFLGLQSLWRLRGEVSEVPVPPSAHIVRDGFFVAALNPKTALFFAAFVPQFFVPESSVLLQGVVLGTVFVLIAAASDSIYVLLASSVKYFGGTVAAHRRLHLFQGIIFITLGVLAVTR